MAGYSNMLFIFCIAYLQVLSQEIFSVGYSVDYLVVIHSGLVGCEEGG